MHYRVLEKLREAGIGFKQKKDGTYLVNGRYILDPKTGAWHNVDRLMHGGTVHSLITWIKSK